jgi:Ca2+-binding EF-hand superfamily protein
MELLILLDLVFIHVFTGQNGLGDKQASGEPDDVETRQAFKVFDKNSDGFIDEHELKQTMKELGVTLSPNDVNDMFVKAGCTDSKHKRITYAGN